MRPRGRPPLPRGVYSYESTSLPCPAEALLDTSFVVEALLPRQPGHTAAQEYITRLLSAGTTIYYNRLLEMELAETAFKIALKERFGGRHWARMRHDGRARRRAGRLMENARSAWDDVLGYFPYACIELHEVTSEVAELMRRYGLSSYDAVHAASALYAGAPIVSRDAGFAALPASQLAIFTDASRVTVCRQRRA